MIVTTTLDDKVLSMFEPGEIVVNKGIAHPSELFQNVAAYRERLRSSSAGNT